MTSLPTFADVQAAARRLEGVTLRTPLLAYWVRKMALIKPSGMATIMAMIAPMKMRQRSFTA